MILDIRFLQKKLINEINNSSKIFVTGHIGPDFDSIGASFGIRHICNYFNKDSYIVVDDSSSKLEPGVKKIMDENKKDIFVNRKNTLRLLDDNSILVLVDVNKKDRTCFENDFERFKKVLIIDHHELLDKSLENDDMFISQESSSACEIVSRILNNAKIPYNGILANYLLAGISLDTKRFKISTTATTHDVAEKLIENGADICYVNNLFLEEFESYCRISNLIINGTIIKKYTNSLSPIQVSFTLNRNEPHKIYFKEDYAKAADRMLKFNGIDASFTLGYVDKENVHISSRSNKKVNVGKILERLGGGGNNQQAGGVVKSDDILSVENELMKYVPLGINDEEELEEPKIIKIKQIKKSYS